MNKSILVVSVLLMGALATPVMAEEGRGNIGLAFKAISIATTTGGTTNTFQWGGIALVGGYDFTDFISLRGSYYTLVETADSNSEMNGFDVDVRFGPNGLGFTYYGSLGYFSDTWNGSTGGVSQDYSGGTFGTGIGYNWDSFNVDWNILNIRSKSDYPATTDLVGSGTLSLSYRF